MSSADVCSGGQSVHKATSREWIGLAVLTLPCMLYALDRTVLNLALPQISAELQPTSPQLLWIVDIYGFLLAGLLITMGTLGDRIGRRRLLLTGALAFGAASMLAALASSTTMLIVARALMGIAAATLAPSTLSLIRQMFLDPDQRTFAIGIWAASHSVGGAIGPIVGGLLLQYFGWCSVFWIAVPVMALLLALGPVLLPEFRRAVPTTRIDMTSAAQSVAAVLLVAYGIKQIAARGWQWLAAVSVVAGVILAVTFARRQGRLRTPLIDPRLLRTPAFTAALLAYTVGCFVAGGISLFTAQYLQLVIGMEPLRAGLWTLPTTLGFVIGSMVVPATTRWAPPVRLMSAGLVLVAAGLGTIAQVDRHSPLEVLACGLFIFSLGLAVVFVPAIGLMVSRAPSERAGEAAAVSETGSELGAALGVALLGSLGTAIYRSGIAGALAPELTPAVTQAASETLGGAVAAAQYLPEAVSAPLLVMVRAAFTSSFHAVIAISAGAMIATAIAIIAMTHRRLSVVSKKHAERLDEAGR